MLGTQFYNEAVRKTVIGFGTLFNNIELKKIVNGQVMEVEKVPLAYGPKQKFLYRLQGNPVDGRKVAITLPRIYFEMTGIAVEKIVTGYPLVPNCGWTTMGIILIPFASKIWYPSSLWAL